MRAIIDGRTYPGLYGLKRMDVLALLKEHPSGRILRLQGRGGTAAGRPDLVLEVGDEQGAWHRFFAARLHVDQDTGQRELTAYENWINVYDRHTPESLTALAANAASLARQPLISIVLPVYNTAGEMAGPDHRFGAGAGVSALGAVHRRRRLDRPARAAVARALRRGRPADQGRFRRETNGHISAASNSALALATGEWIALLDHDDALAPHALYEVAALLNARPETDLVYSDEDKIDRDGHRHSPYFKPDFLPDLFTGQNYISHLTVYRAALVRELGGFRVGYEGSQDWDLALRYVERIKPERIRHIPKVLYHWRAVAGSTALLPDEKTYYVEAARKALGEHFARRGEAVELLPVAGGHWRVKYRLPSPAAVRVAHRADAQRPAPAPALRRQHPREDHLPRLRDHPRRQRLRRPRDPRLPPRPRERRAGAAPDVRVLRDDAPFNYSALNNRAVRAARGAIVGLLNNDLEVINGDWLDEMASQAARPGIGCVGAMLYYPNNTIQHAGVVLGVGGVAAHAFRDLERGSEGRFNRARLVQNYSAVTAACLVIRKAVYEEVGGLDEQELAVAFNDIDFCLKVRAAGYRNLWTPFAELYHHESASRGADDTEEKRERFRRETETMLARWGDGTGRRSRLQSQSHAGAHRFLARRPAAGLETVAGGRGPPG